MIIDRYKMARVSLFMITIYFWLIPFPIHAASRDITVKALTTSGAIKDIKLYSEYHALVIGIGDYRKGWPRLPNPVKDAKEVATILKNFDWTVDVLLDPDGATLRSKLNRLVTGPGRKRDKAILVWYSGHGQTIEEADGTKLGYLVPVDAPDPNKDLFEFMERAVSMRQIETVSKQIRSKHVLMLFDSCFSGAIFQMVRSKPSPYIQEKVSYPVRQFITAGTEDETVPDKSVFKELFIQGLTNGFADLNQDSFITGEEIGAYLQENVINYSRNNQHPQFGKINNPFLDRGDFVFVVNKVDELQIALMKIKKLEQENKELKRKLEEKGKYQAIGKSAMDKTVYGKVNTETKRKLAIFPIYQPNMLENTLEQNKRFTNFVIELINKISNIILTSSVYPYDKYLINHEIDDIRELFNEKTVKDIWYGNSKRAKKEPDFNVLKKISEQIDADLVLIFKVEVNRSSQAGIILYKGYIIDVKKKKYYEKDYDDFDTEFIKIAMLKDITKDLFEIYQKSNL